MYSWELDNKIRESNYILDSQTYIDICQSSPQISMVKYLPYGNEFEMRTYDGYYWKFKVIRKED